ncbi:hypothetical protein DC977_21780 [Escherichia coli]|nr:hypothetical protein [Escherichia coli]EFO0174884.1 hypothetical protein [Escherichia coli]
MNTNKQLPSDIDLGKKFTLQFWLYKNEKVISGPGTENPFSAELIESAHPFTPLQQGQWVELDTTGPYGPGPKQFLVRDVFHRLKRQGKTRESGNELAHWHTDVVVQEMPLQEALTSWYR